MNQTLSVLIVEDSEDDALLLTRELRRGGFAFDFQRVETTQEMKAALARQTFNVILADYHLPRFNASAALKIAQAHNPDLPFIIVSGAIGEELAVAMMKAGAHDYIMKDNLARLVPAIERELREAQVRQDRKQAEEELHFQKALLEAQHELSLDGILMVSNERKWVSYNQRLIEIFGFPPEIIQEGSSHKALAYAKNQFADPEAFIQKKEFLYDHPKSESFDELVTTAGRYLERYSAPIKADGAYYGRVWYYRDVTEQKERELALQASEQLLKAIADNFPNSYLSVINKDLTIGFTFGQEFKNQQLNPENFVGLHLKDVFGLYGEEILNKVTEAYLKTFEGETQSFELFINQQHQAYETVPLPDENGAIERILAVVQNITERKQTELMFKIRARQQAAIAELGQLALTGIELTTLFDSVVIRLARILEVDYCKVLELLPGGQELLLRAGVGWQAGLVGQALIGAGANSQAGYTLLSNEPVIVEDLRTEPRFSGPPFLHHHGVVSGMSVIIQGKEHPFGVLGVHTCQRRIFTQDDIQFLQAVANILAQAITRNQHEEALQRYSQRLEILREIDRSIVAARTTQEIIEPVLKGIRRLILCQRSSVTLFDESFTEMLFFASNVDYDSTYQGGKRIPFVHSKRFEGLQSGQIQVVADLRLLEDADSQLVSQLIKEGMRSSLFAPLMIQGKLIGALNLTANSTNFFISEHQEIAGEVANQLAIALHQNRLFEAEREQRLQAETLREVTLALTAQIKLEAVLDEILNQVRRVVPHRTSNIALLDGNTLRTVHWQGYEGLIDDNIMSNWTHPLDKYSIDRQAIKTGQPVVIHDTRQEPAWLIVPETEWVLSYLAIPIHWRDQALGILRLDGTTPGEFSLNDAKRLMSLASAAGIALENARLYQLVQQNVGELEQRVAERTSELREQYQQQAIMEERQRLARDLHDAVSQTLFSATMLAEAIPRLWNKRPEQAKQSMLELHRLNRGAMAEMRSLLLELRPTALTEANLTDLLRQLADALAGRTEITISMAVNGEPTLPVATKIAFYRIAQEALNNISKHARASQVWITLANSSNQVKLTIADNGRGFNRQQLPAGRLGLTIMRERAEAIGANLQVSSQPSQGTQVNLIWSDEM